jgi:hypothetical protein
VVSRDQVLEVQRRQPLHVARIAGRTLPTIGAAIAAQYWFLWIRCPACRPVIHIYAKLGRASGVPQFEQVRAHDPVDRVPALFIERCARYLRELPPSDW